MENCLEAIRRARTARAAAEEPARHPTTCGSRSGPWSTPTRRQLTDAAEQDHAAHRRGRHRGGPGPGARSPRPTGLDAAGHPVPRAARRRGDRLARASRRPSRSSRWTSTPARSCGPRRRGLVYPYELTGDARRSGRHRWSSTTSTTPASLVPVERPTRPQQGRRSSRASSPRPTARHPEGVTRVVLLRRPDQGARRAVRAGVLAGDRRPRPGRADAGARWSGSRCPPARGSRWTRAPRTWTGWRPALKRIVEFTQDGGEINIVVAGINVGAQPYWNAEATMLMHTKGILVMTPDSAMVLTGKQSLDFSGGVSAEDNFGIGGYDRVMGPNGQAQYWAPDLAGRARRADGALRPHLRRRPGRTRPRRGDHHRPGRPRRLDVPARRRRTATSAPSARSSPPATNPDRKKAFDIRTVMRALADQDHPTLERWAGMADAETAVVQDAHLGGYPGVPARHRVPVGAAARLPAHRRPGHLHRRARCSRGRRRRPPGRSTPPAATGRWWCWRTCPASTARRSRCASCSWSTAPRSAGRS